MRRWLLAMALLPSVALATGANPLTAERDYTRPLVLVAPSPADPAAAALAHALAQPQTRAELSDRQIVVYTVLAGRGTRDGAPLAPAETTGLLAALGLSADSPAVTLLIGKDGGVKMRRAQLGVPEILATIDGMPLRRWEMGRR